MTQSLNVKSGGAWRTAVGVFARTGGTWKSVTKVFVRVAGVWQQAWGSLVIAAMSGNAYASDSALSQAKFFVKRDGTYGFQAIGGITATASPTVGTPWITPSSPTVGDGYWVKVSSGSYIDLPTNDSINVWLQLNVDRHWDYQGSIGSPNHLMTFTVLLSNDGGATTLTTGASSTLAAYKI